MAGSGFSTSFSDITGGLNDLFGSSGSQSVNGTQDIEYSGTNSKKSATDSGQTTTNNNSGNVVTNSGNQSITAGDSTQKSNASSTTDSSSHTYNSGRTDVQQLMLTQQGMDNMVRTIMEGVNGLASVTSNQNRTGLYNASTNQLLTDDLVTRTAGYVAEKSAPLVTKIGDSYSDTNSSSTTNSVSSLVQNSNSSTATGPSTITTGPSTTTSTTGPRTLEELVSEDPKSVKSTTNSTTGTEKDGLLSWIICTELYKQGKFGYREYVIGSTKFAEYDEQIKKGYYIWAVPSVHHLRKHPDSKYSRFLKVWFNARAEHICVMQGKRKYEKRSILRPISYYATHALCWILSRTVALNYSYDSNSVYGVSHG